MNQTQSCIIQVLNYALHGKTTAINENINWEELIQECRNHQIASLVYSGISKDTLNNIEKPLLERWKKEIFMSGVYQINHINQVSHVLSIFNENNIPVIVLKGLVIRDLYPKSELRTMGDADILVHEKDLLKVSKILMGLGYKEEGRNAFHIEFGKGTSHIEVHWTLANESMFNGIVEFKNELWSNSVAVNIGKSHALSMCDEDLLLYLFIHMAKHLKYSGFGIRQVCDVVLLIEDRWQFINWRRFLNKSKRSGVEKFTLSMFIICNKLFKMTIPKDLNEYIAFDDKYIDVLIDEIFSNGVHGKVDKALERSKILTSNNENNSVFKSIKDMYFPSIDKLSDKYEYVNKNKILLPFAWIHRIINTIFRTDYSLSDKIKLSVKSTGISKKHSELLNWLEL